MSTQHKRSLVAKTHTASSMPKNLHEAVDKQGHLRQTALICQICLI